MADSRFASFNEGELQKLKEQAKNKNTKKSTQTWLNVWRSWAVERQCNPNLEEYSAEELDKVLQRFYAEVRNKHGEQYEPESLKVMMASLDRYLREHSYPHSIIKDRQFQQSKQVLEGKAKLLRQDGKGKRPNAANALTIPEEEVLWESEKLGSCSPKVLSQTMWWILTQHFGLRGRQEHHSMAIEDFSLCRDDAGVELEYITFKDQQDHMLKTYFKFTFVCEPFERLLSAYKDKFVNIRGIDHRMLKLHGRNILKLTRPDATEHALQKFDDITFREFVEYLVTKGSSESCPIMDWHWDNYIHTCGMCAVKYDFIGHYETFNQDIEDFKKAAGLSPEEAKFFAAHERNVSSTGSSMIDYYSKIPLKWIEMLGEIYRPSFEMFGYSFPGPLKSLFENRNDQ